MTAFHWASVVLVGQLFVISAFDIKTLRIPQVFSLSLGVTGAIISFRLEARTYIDVGLSTLVFGGLLLIIRLVHSALTARIGLGMGDVKLAAAIGCWIKVDALAIFLAFASCSALLVVFVAKVQQPALNLRTFRLPFGPFLCASAAGVWFTQ
ncbi:prepilin peptidase [Allorhizobium undicola]|uniref:prepilin peptidase n=1 Tax=Allorhizobium undicola TaxID=78527 RepID=UPI00068584AD|nr:A24 family peptidase [Allorhizobium undicola]